MPILKKAQISPSCQTAHTAYKGADSYFLCQHLQKLIKRDTIGNTAFTRASLILQTTRKAADNHSAPPWTKPWYMLHFLFQSSITGITHKSNHCILPPQYLNSFYPNVIPPYPCSFDSNNVSTASSLVRNILHGETR